MTTSELVGLLKSSVHKFNEWRSINPGGDADLGDADLGYADLGGANLGGADLSGVKNLLGASDWLLKNFAIHADGVIVYKVFSYFKCSPCDWDISPGSVIVENGINPNRTTECGSGINFGTPKWLSVYTNNKTIWECLIKWIDLADVVVPYNTDGKARCRRLTLLREVKLSEIEPVETEPTHA